MRRFVVFIRRLRIPFVPELGMAKSGSFIRGGHYEYGYVCKSIHPKLVELWR